MRQKLPLMLFFVMLAGFSCSKTEEETPNFGHEEARAFFESAELQGQNLQVWPYNKIPETRSGETPLPITPLWGNGRSFSNDGNEYVEFPLDSPVGKLFFKQESGEPLPDEEKYANTQARLLATRTPDGDYRYQVVQLTADAGFLGEGREIERLLSLSLGKMDGFSGTVRYFELDGTMTDGKIYEDGVVVKSITPWGDEGNGPLTRTANTYETVCGLHMMEYEYCYYTGYYDEIYGFWVETYYECRYEYWWEEACDLYWVDYDEDDGPGTPPPGSDGPGGSTNAMNGDPVTTHRGIHLMDAYTEQIIAPFLNQIARDCAGGVLLTNLAQYGVRILHNPNLGSYEGNAFATTDATNGTGNIQWKQTNDSRIEYIILEELFHAYQIRSGNYNSQAKLNHEAEAKVFVWKYCDRNNINLNQQDISGAWQQVEGYVRNPFPMIYNNNLIPAVRMMGYDDGILFPDHPNYRHTNNSDFLNNGC